MKINGYDVLVSERAWRSFCTKIYHNQEEKPREYPCIPRAVLDSYAYEESHYEFITMTDINKMAGALVRAEVQMRRMRQAKKNCGVGGVFASPGKLD